MKGFIYRFWTFALDNQDKDVWSPYTVRATACDSVKSIITISSWTQPLNRFDSSEQSELSSLLSKNILKLGNPKYIHQLIRKMVNNHSLLTQPDGKCWWFSAIIFTIHSCKQRKGIFKGWLHNLEKNIFSVICFILLNWLSDKSDINNSP